MTKTVTLLAGLVPTRRTLRTGLNPYRRKRAKCSAITSHEVRGMSKTHSRPLGVVASAVAAALLALGAAAQPTAPEPSKADEAAEKAIAESAARADRLLEQGKFAEAAGPAREAANLAARAYGPSHWRMFDADRRLRLAETARDWPADKGKRLVEAIGAEAQARGLEGSKPAEAEKLALARRMDMPRSSASRRRNTPGAGTWSAESGWQRTTPRGPRKRIRKRWRSAARPCLRATPTSPGA